MVVVHLFLLAAAVMRATTGDFSEELLSLAGFTEPALILSLIVLCGARRLLHGMSYVASWIVVLLFELGLAWMLFHIGHGMGYGLVPGSAGLPFPQVGFLVLFITSCTLAYFDLRSRSLAPAVSEARIQALQARIRPHFLYNSINAVLSLIRADPRRAERVLEDLADLFRVLMADKGTLAPIGEEIELVKQYLAIEEIRLGDRLRVAWKTDGLPLDALVPPLMLQPLVENAVYHGIEPSDSGGEIAIEAAMVGNRIVLSLTNPYPGESRITAGNRMAIGNIRERLQLHFDAEADMKSEVKDRVYRVTIRLPYLTAAA
jgi:two-component system sensor histidine kinase AlgZ